MKRSILLLFALAVVTGLLWYGLSEMHPLFTADEAIAEGRQAGGLTAEALVEINAANLQSAFVTYAIWGSVMGLFCGLLVHPSPKSRLVGGVVGLLVGAVAGLGSAWLSDWYIFHTESPQDLIMHWLKRLSLVLLPIAVAIAIAVSASGRFSAEIVERLIGAAIGGVFGIAIYVFLMGVVTPIGGHEYLYPAFKSNQLLLLAAFNLSVLVVLLLQFRKGPATAAASVPTQPDKPSE